MNEKNRLVQPFIMVLSVTVLLLVLSLFDTEWNIAGYKTKRVAPLSDITAAGLLKKSPLPSVILNDSIIRTDSVAFAARQVDSSNIFDFGPDTSSALSHFFEALNNLKKKKGRARIAYFGDSMIEGDLITQDLRSKLQASFGGFGVGFVPVTSVVSGFRTSVIHSFDGWITYNLLGEMPANRMLGIAGYTFVPAPMAVDTSNNSSGSWVRYAAVKQKNIDKFYTARLLYGKSSGDNYVLINGSRHKLDGGNTVNQVEIHSQNPMTALQARFQCPQPPDIYGFSLESDSGAFVDNFSFRGNSGLPITKIPQSVYSGTSAILDYDLVVLEYGLNAVDPNVTDFSWYERGMNNAIRHIRASFPDASILLISVGDKSYRKNGEYQTDPSVPLMVQVQRRMAKEHKLAFWSLYDAMGGSGSMVKWVEGDTSYANRDYTHFNFRGAHRVGNLLYDKLMLEYNDYNKKKRQ